MILYALGVAGVALVALALTILVSARLADPVADAVLDVLETRGDWTGQHALFAAVVRLRAVGKTDYGRFLFGVALGMLEESGAIVSRAGRYEQEFSAAKPQAQAATEGDECHA